MENRPPGPSKRPHRQHGIRLQHWVGGDIKGAVVTSRALDWLCCLKFWTSLSSLLFVYMIELKLMRRIFRSSPLLFRTQRTLLGRFCAGRQNGSGVSPPRSSQTAASTTVSTEDHIRSLSDVKEISDADKELLRAALLHEKDHQPVFSGGPRLGGQGSGIDHGDMAAVFTCEVCNTRSVKKFTRYCYTKGIVIVQCPGCGNKHLLADNLGWFRDEHKTIEEILMARGEQVVRLQGSIHIDRLEGDVSKK